MKDGKVVSYELQKADFLFLATILFGIAGSYILSATGIARSCYQLGVLFSELVYFLPIPLLFAWERKRGIRTSVLEEFRVKKVKPVTIFLTVLFTILIRPFITMINAVSMLFVKNETGMAISASVSGMPVFIGILMVGVVPAFVEEIVYRGFFYQKYRLLGGIRGAIFSGLLFGMMHLNFNQFAYAFVMGVILCFLMEATDSIWPGILTHFLLNGSSAVFVFLSSFLSGSENASKAINEGMKQVLTREEILSYIRDGWFSAVIFLVVSVLLLIQIAKQENRSMIPSLEEDSGSSGEARKKMPGILYFTASFVCISLMILSEYA